MNEILDEIADPETAQSRREQLQGELLTAQIDIQDTIRQITALNPPSRVLFEPDDELRPSSTIGDDDRIAVFDTTVHPWNSVCRITASQGGGTGFLVAPKLVVTLDYVLGGGFLSDKKNLESDADVLVECSFDSNGTPRVSTKSLKVILDKDEEAIGVAGIVLSEAVTEPTDFLTLKSMPTPALLSSVVSVAGYPSGQESGVLYRDSGPVLQVTNDSLTYVVDTGYGVGGAPVMVLAENRYVVAGFHTRRTLNAREGLRVTPRIEELVGQWSEMIH